MISDDLFMELTDETFENVLAKTPALVLVEFTNSWQGASQIMLPSLKRLAQEYRSQVRFYRVLVEKNPGLTNKYRIGSLPVLLFFKESRLVDEISGIVPGDVLLDKVNKWKQQIIIINQLYKENQNEESSYHVHKFIVFKFWMRRKYG